MLRSAIDEASAPNRLGKTSRPTLDPRRADYERRCRNAVAPFQATRGCPEDRGAFVFAAPPGESHFWACPCGVTNNAEVKWKHCANKALQCTQVALCKEWSRGRGRCHHGPGCAFAHLAICLDPELTRAAEAAFARTRRKPGRKDTEDYSVPWEAVVGALGKRGNGGGAPAPAAAPSAAARKPAGGSAWGPRV